MKDKQLLFDRVIYSVADDIFGRPINELAMRFRDDIDLVNTIELLNRLGEDVRTFHEEKQAEAIRAGIPALFASFMPKSGGTYLHNSLLRAGATEIFHHTQSPINFYQAYLIPSWLAIFMKGGTACHTHLMPTPYNRTVIEECDVQRIWVHIRDPRQAALSSYWHAQGEGQGAAEIGERRRLEELDRQLNRANLEQLRGVAPLQSYGFEDYIKLQFVIIQQWALDWIRFSRAQSHLSFLFTTYEEMTENPRSFERRVCEFYQWEVGDNPFLGGVTAEDRYRKGIADEWREVYSPSLKSWLEDRLDTDLISMLQRS